MRDRPGLVQYIHFGRERIDSGHELLPHDLLTSAFLALRMNDFNKLGEGQGTTLRHRLKRLQREDVSADLRRGQMPVDGEGSVDGLCVLGHVRWQAIEAAADFVAKQT